MALTRRQRRSAIVEFLDGLTNLGLKLGGAIAALALGYLIYGLVARNGLAQLGALSHDDRARVIANVGFACSLVVTGGGVAAACAAARYHTEETLGYLMSFFGIVVYFAVPWWVSIGFSSWELRANLAIATIVSQMQLLGIIVFLVGSALVVREVALRITSSLQDRERKTARSAFRVGGQAEPVEEPYKRRLYPKCWQMQYCRAFIRKVCPAYESGRSCWRRKSGCMCDGDTIARALSSQTGEGRLFARDLQYRLGTIPQKSSLTPAEKRQRCRDCVIYRLHQEQKYKLTSPFVFPAVGALIWALFPALESMFRAFLSFTERVMRNMSFLPSSGESSGGWSVPDAVLYVFVAWLAIVVVSYALQFLEFCIFKVQI